jgi:NAD(P)-dependent dehydrogenase (short-subunit alcohol dehydrogenase family)
MSISIITGAASGIGRAVALRHASLGFTVFALDVDEVGLLETKNSSKGDIRLLTCDVSNPREIESAFLIIDQTGLEIDNFVAAAGIGLYEKYEDMTFEQLSRVINVNLIGVLEPAKYAYQRMHSGSSMVFVASIMATHSLFNSVAYSATKGAVVAAARTLALEAGEKGIRVNSVSPGTIDTPMLRKDLTSMNRNEQAEFISKVNAANALGKIGTTEEVANLISFLISDQASYITASDYRIDAGFGALKKF